MKWHGHFLGEILRVTYYSLCEINFIIREEVK
jgi:hypothetical protein